MKLRNLVLATSLLVASGVVSAQTAVTPATGGTANPFAYALSSTVENGVIKVNYSLNEKASAASLIVKNSAGQAVITQTLSGLTKGAHTVSVDLSGQPSDTYTWEINVTGAAQTAVKEFKELKFYHPSGLDVDNSMESPSFGTLFVAEGYTNGKTSGYVSAQADGKEGSGLYMYTAGGDQILNKDGKPRFNNPSLTFSKTLGTSTSAGADYARVAVAEDGRIFVTRHNNEGDFILSAKSVEDLKNGGELTSLVAGKTMTDTKYYTDANGNFLVGPNQGFDVKGSGENTKLIALSCATNSMAFEYSNNRTLEHKIGTSNTLPTGTAVAALDKKYTIAYDRSVNVAYDNRGGIWYCQSRSAATNAQPSLVYVDANGEIKYFEGDGGTARRRGAMAVSPDGTQLAAASIYNSSGNSQFSVYNINYAEDGTVSLTESHRITTPGVNLYCLAWDVAGNVYAGNATKEYVKGFAIPRANNDFSTKAASKYAVKYEAGPVVPTVTPGAGDANPYAYALSSTAEEGVININYSLNADAEGAEVVVKNSKGEAVVTQSLEGTKKGAHTATVSLEGQETDTYTWEIKVTGAAQSEIKEFAAYRFYHPRGVDVDNNMESAAFGNIYVTEGIKTTSATYWSGNGGGNGLYIFTPDMQPVKNPQTGLYAFMGGFTPDERVASGSVTEGADLARVRVAEDGRIFVTRCNDTGSYIAVAKDAETLIAENKFTSLLGAGSLDASTYAFNDASGNFIAGPNLGFDIKGSGENLKMMALSAQQALWVYSWKGSRIDEYALGNGTTLPAPVQHAALPQATTAPQTTNVEYDNRGGFWYCQMRQSPTDANPALVYVDANGEQKYFEGAGGKYRGGAGIRLNADNTQIAISSSTTTFTIYDIEYAADNTPILTEKYIVNHGIGRNLYDIAWDLAGNIYICGNSGEYLKGFSIPRESNEFTTTAASKYAVSYEAPAPEPTYEPLYMVGYNNTWNPEDPTEIPYDVEKGVYFLSDVNFVSDRCKISRAKGSWDTFNANGICSSDDATIKVGTPCSLYLYYCNDIVIEKTGTYDITIDMENATILLEEKVVYPEVIYAIGNVNELSWSTSEGVAFTHKGDGVYEGTINVDNVDGGYGYFQFATTLGGSWDAVNAGTRYGATEQDLLIENGQIYNMTNNWGGDTKSWKCEAGIVEIEVDIANNTMKIVSLTGVENIEVDNADVEYYNLQGVKVDNPTNGTYIKVQGNKTTKVYIK